ncbi:hypothetical protein KIW84_041106 [Lathyrus oleraceus]|uniref:DUF7745 domain-containing protein n=1 Tax=Pisum sativum TaxID=3888 RepID=A0A9D5AKX9_PEA|nr:hypothetical protein KIW84_041106 [Pisum sativum]
MGKFEGDHGVAKAWMGLSLFDVFLFKIIFCGEFSHVPLLGTQGGINYNPALACRQLGFPLRGKPNNTQLEGLFYQEALEDYTTWVKKRALELKMPYACERPMSMVVAEPLTLPNQDLESKDKDSLIELLEDQAVKRQREPEGPSPSSMPQSSGAWKKIVDQLVLEKAQMKTSFESEIRRIRRKYVQLDHLTLLLGDPYDD